MVKMLLITMMEDLQENLKRLFRKRSRKNANMKEMKFKYKTKEEKQHGGKTKQRRTGG
jgi:hypothetical protein